MEHNGAVLSARARIEEAKHAFDQALRDALADLAQGLGRSPAAADVMRALDVSRATAYRYLSRVRAAGGSNA